MNSAAGCKAFFRSEFNGRCPAFGARRSAVHQRVVKTWALLGQDIGNTWQASRPGLPLDSGPAEENKAGHLPCILDI
jgi:hypothetical protein